MSVPAFAFFSNSCWLRQIKGECLASFFELMLLVRPYLRLGLDGSFTLVLLWLPTPALLVMLDSGFLLRFFDELNADSLIFSGLILLKPPPSFASPEVISVLCVNWLAISILWLTMLLTTLFPAALSSSPPSPSRGLVSSSRLWASNWPRVSFVEIFFLIAVWDLCSRLSPLVFDASA